MHPSSICLFAVRKLFLVITVICVCLQSHAQLKWDGGGGDGLWNTPANWVGDIVPGAGDDVLLDNSIVAVNYIVTLPSGTSVVSVKTLIILPSSPQVIEVRLPFSNTAVPAFIASSSMYGLEIYNGGIFRNSSGASAGTPVDISDSIKIHNGGWYIHNSSRAHAGNVAVLSKVTGTEGGNFEFDVPGGSGYTISIAARVYGNLILSAVSAGGAKSYTSTGTTAVNINGQFKINPGVNYSLNFNGAFIVRGDFIHSGNMFDISGGLYSNTVSLRKNIILSGTITETGTGIPVVEFDGSDPQDIFVTGAITQNITIRVNNSAGITLQNSISIFYKLELTKGNIRTSAANMLEMHDNSSCAGGSVNSYVDGPMRKLGDDDFDFPVGKQGNYAPASISGTGGSVNDEFEVEYFLGGPGTTFGTTIESPPIVRISGLEYWKIERMIGTSPKKITLNVSTYSDATLLEKLLVTRWDVAGSIWRDEGNTAYSGIATGTITSNDISQFGVFTIATTVSNQNPLPLDIVSFSATRDNAYTVLRWQVEPSLPVQRFELLKSADGIHFRSIHSIPAIPGKNKYEFQDALSAPGTYYYKVRVIDKNGNSFESNVQSVSHYKSPVQLQVAFEAASQAVHVTLNAPGRAIVRIVVLNNEGKVVREIATPVNGISQNLSLDVSTLPRGVYYITGILNGARTNVVRFVKML